MRIRLASRPGSTHQAREATNHSRSTCSSWSPAIPARSAAAIRDVNRRTSPSGRVRAVSSTHVTRARSNSPRSSCSTSRSSGTTTSAPPQLDSEPGSGEQTPAAAGRLAEFRGTSHRSYRDRDRAAMLRPRSCLFELERDVLMLAGEQSRAVPGTAVGLIRQDIRQGLMSTPTVRSGPRSARPPSESADGGSGTCADRRR